MSKKKDKAMKNMTIPGFIRLTDFKDGEPVFIRPSSVTSICPIPAGTPYGGGGMFGEEQKISKKAVTTIRMGNGGIAVKVTIDVVAEIMSGTYVEPTGAAVIDIQTKIKGA